MNPDDVTDGCAPSKSKKGKRKRTTIEIVTPLFSAFPCRTSIAAVSNTRGHDIADNFMTEECVSMCISDKRQYQEQSDKSYKQTVI